MSCYVVGSRSQDVGDAAKALDKARFAAFKQDPFFSASAGGVEAWSTKEFGVAMEEATAVRKT